MEIQTRYKVIAGVIVVVVSFATGRYLTPTKVRVETKIVEVEKKVTDTNKKIDKDTDKKTTITKKILPSGETQVTIVKEENTKKKTDVDQTVTKDNKTTENDKKITVADKGIVTINAMGGIDINTGKPAYGGSVTGKVIGPISVGGFGLSNGLIGAIIGIVF